MYWNPLKFDRMEMEIVRDGVFFKIYFEKISLREHRSDSAEKTGGRVHGSCCHESSVATVERGERVL